MRRNRISYSVPPRVTIRAVSPTTGYPVKRQAPLDVAAEIGEDAKRTYNMFGESDQPFESDVAPDSMGSGADLESDEAKGDDPLSKWY